MASSPDDNWDQLAELLGLGEEKLATPAPTKPVAERGRRRSRRAAEPRHERESKDAMEPDSVSDVEEIEVPAESPTDDDETPEGDAPAKKRRRRRSRRKKATPEEAAPSAETPESTGADDEDADLAESYASLKMPTWQELIDSLYRPDR
jgi:hypothetical protein